MRHNLLLAFLLAVPAWAAVVPREIPRLPSREFRSEGLFEGGTPRKANVESVRLSPGKDTERWTIEFSEEMTRKVGRVAPRFQLRYEHADKFISQEGEKVQSRPARFVLLFRGVGHCFVKEAALLALARKSRFVKDVQVYPPIENGDMVMELVLYDDVLFEPFQPLRREGQLVLDLRAS
jgi:hypothetical protein